MTELAPIVLFTYKRLDTLQQTVHALANNSLADKSDLIIYSDGAKKLEDEPIIQEIRNYLKTVTGFKSVTIHESPINKGLATSIINGVSEVMAMYKKAIVLEDDLITSTNFLEYMNQALNYYQDNPRILSVSGYSPIIKGLNPNEIYYTQRASSWGWACWEDRWQKIDWQAQSYESFVKDSQAKSRFNQMGSDMCLMMKRQMQGKINSWAIRFCFHQFQNDLYSVHPSISKIQNIGFSEKNATNTVQKYNRFQSEFDKSNSLAFNFNTVIQLDKRLIQQFVRDNSIKMRILNKVLNYIQ
ncbi:glycosyltransferase [Flavobacterium cellulosilyticum]|uniref:Glycosyltransferase n=1 Tax=Flavobacterium cellulosilyticum TaxID=2541731 RepID=A0A4R5CD51_9FLAO|nr:glycosyltransferase [Flavobacterium cellulosilyticum]TDD95072.1 glycosyltransferase [Flavobacterium cellulosilyticum]